MTQLKQLYLGWGVAVVTMVAFALSSIVPASADQIETHDEDTAVAAEHQEDVATIPTPVTEVDDQEGQATNPAPTDGVPDSPSEPAGTVDTAPVENSGEGEAAPVATDQPEPTAPSTISTREARDPAPAVVPSTPTRTVTPPSSSSTPTGSTGAVTSNGAPSQPAVVGLHADPNSTPTSSIAKPAGDKPKDKPKVKEADTPSVWEDNDTSGSDSDDDDYDPYGGYDPFQPGDDPMVVPAVDPIPLAPVPTLDEWYKGLKYLYPECVLGYGLDNRSAVIAMLNHEPGAVPYHLAFECFNVEKYDPHMYPSFNRTSGGDTPGGDTPGGDTPVTPGPVTPGPVTPGQGGAGVRPNNPGRVDTPVQPRRNSGIQYINGQAYVIPWSAQRVRTYSNAGLGDAVQYATSESFVDSSQFVDGMIQPPAGPDQAKLSEVLEELGLTSAEIPWGGSGTATAIDGNSSGTGGGKKLTYQVQMEGNMPVDNRVFVSKFQETLDKDTRYRFERRSVGATDITFVVGSPLMTQQLCEPDKKPVLNPSDATGEPDNCVTRDKKIVINLRLWSFGPKGAMDGVSASSNISSTEEKANQKYRDKLLSDSVTDALR